VAGDGQVEVTGDERDPIPVEDSVPDRLLALDPPKR